MSYGNKCGHAKAFDSGIAGAEFITKAHQLPELSEINQSEVSTDEMGHPVEP